MMALVEPTGCASPPLLPKSAFLLVYELQPAKEAQLLRDESKGLYGPAEEPLKLLIPLASPERRQRAAVAWFDRQSFDQTG